MDNGVRSGVTSTVHYQLRIQWLSTTEASALMHTRETLHKLGLQYIT